MPNQEEFKGSPDGDIEPMPTPPKPETRDVVQRIELNAKSLKLLCADLSSFIDRAEKESLRRSNERDQKTMEVTTAYFTRLYALLARISNDVAGHEYTSLYVRKPLQQEEASEEMINNLIDSFEIIEEALQGADRKVLIADPSNYGQAPDQTRDLFPFSNWLNEIKQIVEDMKKVFRS